MRSVADSPDALDGCQGEGVRDLVTALLICRDRFAADEPVAQVAQHGNDRGEKRSEQDAGDSPVDLDPVVMMNDAGACLKAYLGLSRYTSPNIPAL